VMVAAAQIRMKKASNFASQKRFPQQFEEIFFCLFI